MEFSCVLWMKRFITFRAHLLYSMNREAVSKILGGIHVV